MLIMDALAPGKCEIENLSRSDDTRLLQMALAGRSRVRDIGHAGTAMRFLTAYFAIQDDKVVLTGSDRMKERPMGPLVKALKELGASVHYMEKEGFPPLEIEGGLKKGGHITLDGGISSQFISALMMIGPVLRGGLKITLTGDVVSSTYIHMTLSLMTRGGIEAAFDGREVMVREGRYHFGRFRVESDWSGASYWYQVAALCPGSVIRLPDLERDSLQGDAILVSLYNSLGVETRFAEDAVILHSGKPFTVDHFTADFAGFPDLVQTCAATLCAMGIPFSFSGTRTLKVKETDRITALQSELGKLGFRIEADMHGNRISWDGTRCQPEEGAVIETYHDHRMAMAFAPLAIPLGRVTVNDPGVVTKSYPGFWTDLEKAGFTVSREE